MNDDQNKPDESAPDVAPEAKPVTDDGQVESADDHDLIDSEAEVPKADDEAQPTRHSKRSAS